MIERALLQILIIQEDKKTDSYTFLSESECSASYQSNYFFILKLSLALLTTQYFSINLLSNNEVALLEKQVLSWLSGQAVIRSKPLTYHTAVRFSEFSYFFSLEVLHNNFKAIY